MTFYSCVVYTSRYATGAVPAVPSTRSHSLPRSLVVCFEPLDGLSNPIADRRELKGWEVAPELRIVRRLLELAVRLLRIKDELRRGKLERLRDHLRDLSDRDLRGFVDAEDDWLHLGVLAQHPDHEAPEVGAVHELAQRRPRSPDVELAPGFFRDVALVNEARNHVPFLHVEVVEGAVDVRRDHARKVAAICAPRARARRCTGRRESEGERCERSATIVRSKRAARAWEKKEEGRRRAQMTHIR